jgi:bifunctional non-homologous end joining protein LigD
LHEIGQNSTILQKNSHANCMQMTRRGESLTAEKMKECRWVKPKLVCQVAFVEWMDAELLRHRAFVAMRDDKKAAEVVRET